MLTLCPICFLPSPSPSFHFSLPLLPSSLPPLLPPSLPPLPFVQPSPTVCQMVARASIPPSDSPSPPPPLPVDHTTSQGTQTPTRRQVATQLTVDELRQVEITPEHAPPPGSLPLVQEALPPLSIPPIVSKPADGGHGRPLVKENQGSVTVPRYGAGAVSDGAVGAGIGGEWWWWWWGISWGEGDGYWQTSSLAFSSLPSPPSFTPSLSSLP